MAQIVTKKARKEYKCCKCGETINPSDTYKLLQMMYQKPRRACHKCNFKRSETTTSEYLGMIWDLQDDTEINSQEDIEILVSDLETLRDETQDKLENMPEQLQYSENGELLQERVDLLEEAISEMEEIEWPNEDTTKDELELDKEDYKDVKKYNEAIQKKLEEHEEEISNQVLEILGSLG